LCDLPLVHRQPKTGQTSDPQTPYNARSARRVLHFVHRHNSQPGSEKLSDIRPRTSDNPMTYYEEPRGQPNGAKPRPPRPLSVFSSSWLFLPCCFVVRHNNVAMQSTTNLIIASCFLVGQAVAGVVLSTILASEETETETSNVDHQQRGHGRQQGARQRSGVRKGKRAHTRICRSIPEIYESLGPQYFRRAYRMTCESFWKLHDLLLDGIATAVAAKRRQTTTNRKKPNCRPPVPNGVRILSSVHLGCALRYFAGGAPYDLMVKFGILHTEVLDSVWFVVQAINKLKQFFIKYPAEHDKQKQIASAFCYASTTGFSSCAGAIDGILIWIQ
jgi:hypothetical protein